jgi:hypothetical protein
MTEQFLAKNRSACRPGLVHSHQPGDEIMAKALGLTEKETRYAYTRRQLWANAAIAASRVGVNIAARV